MATDDESEAQTGADILGDIERVLRKFSLGTGFEPKNAYSPIIKDFRVERLTASQLPALDESYAGRLERLLDDCQRAEPLLVNDRAGLSKLSFVRGRVYSLLGNWEDAQESFQRALALGYSEGVVRYYLAVTYDLDAPERVEAIKNLERIVELEGRGTKRAVEVKRQIERILNEPPLPKPDLHPSRERSSGCFVATAACGSHGAVEVVILCRFRDEWLLRCAGGRLFVRWYYSVSPFVAMRVARSRWLRCALFHAAVRPAARFATYLLTRAMV